MLYHVLITYSFNRYLLFIALILVTRAAKYKMGTVPALMGIIV